MPEPVSTSALLITPARVGIPTLLKLMGRAGTQAGAHGAYRSTGAR